MPTFTAVAGESGSGKTTLANLILGFLTPTQGEILYKGKDLSKMTPEELQVFRQEVQAIFQDPFEVYNPFYKVDHMLTTPLHKFGLASTRQGRYDLINTALRNVGLN